MLSGCLTSIFEVSEKFLFFPCEKKMVTVIKYFFFFIQDLQTHGIPGLKMRKDEAVLE
jgi:hypothetical protein